MNRSAELDTTTARLARHSRPLAGPVFAALVAFVCTACLARPAQAQPARSKQPAAATSRGSAASASQDAKAFAKLQAKSHRIMAKIVEAEAADSPNQTKIEKLYADLAKVRTEMQAYGRAAAWGPRGGAGRYGGPGAGWRRGGGPGAGWRRGGGPGWGRGNRAARGGRGGAGWGRGRGAAWGGRGPGWRGAGAARGAGANVGNCAPGQCQGPNWSDKNKNGVCDYYEGNSGAKTAPAPKKK